MVAALEYKQQEIHVQVLFIISISQLDSISNLGANVTKQLPQTRQKHAQPTPDTEAKALRLHLTFWHVMARRCQAGAFPHTPNPTPARKLPLPLLLLRLHLPAPGHPDCKS